MQELTTYDGAVHSIIFQNAENGYTVLRLLTEEGEVVTVVGCIPCVAPGEHLTVSGVWETHSQHGEQLRAVEIERRLPEEEEEIVAYLSSGVCKGVGTVTAQRIVDRFGREAFLSPDGEDHFVVTAHVAVSPQFLSWVFSFGKQAEILSPQPVRARFLQYLRETEANYT